MLSSLILASLLLAQDFSDPAFIALLRPAVAAGGCPADGSPSQEQDGSAASHNVCDSAGNVFAGQSKWTNTAVNVCKVAFKLTKVTGDVSALNYVCKIYTNNGSNFTAASPLGTSAAVVGDNAWSGTWVVFSFSTSVAIASSITHALVVTRQDGATDGANFIRVLQNTSGTIPGGVDKFTSSGSFQSGVTEATDCAIRIYWE